MVHDTAAGTRDAHGSRLPGHARCGAAAIVGLLALGATLARADPQPPAPAPARTEHSGIDTVTIEARRRKELEHEVDHFVNSVTGHPRGESVARWNAKICPLVAGLPRTEGEFVLARLSQIAREVHAPLAGEQCAVNFYVVLTQEPGVLLKKWYARDKRMFSTRNGRGAINTFLDSSRPVRVWYNSDLLVRGWHIWTRPTRPPRASSAPASTWLTSRLNAVHRAYAPALWRGLEPLLGHRRGGRQPPGGPELRATRRLRRDDRSGAGAPGCGSGASADNTDPVQRARRTGPLP